MVEADKKELVRIWVTPAAANRVKRYIQKNGGKKQEVASKAILAGLDAMEAKG